MDTSRILVASPHPPLRGTLSRRERGLLLAFTLFALGCGDTTLRPPLAEPRDMSNPGPAHFVGPGGGSGGSGGGSSYGGSGGGTGYGGGTGSTGGGGGVDAGPTLPSCDDSLKRCGVVFTYPAGNEQSVEVRGDFATDGWSKGVAMTKSGSTWSATVPLPWGQPVQYKFVLDGTNWVLDPGNTNTGTQGGVTNSLFAATQCPTDYTCAAPDVPPGVFDWRDAVLYYVFVDRFNDGDPSNNCSVAGVETAANYHGGDWKGVTAKIQSGYFTALGVNTLLITDVVENYTGSGAGSDGHQYSAYHGYWPSDLSTAEHCFGTEADLKALVDAAHAANLKVLLDYAMVHVHINSTVYQQHPSWFWPLSFNGGNCICDDNGVCPWNSAGQRCWFTSYLPHWNYTNPGARAYSVANVVDWVKRIGFDGIRARRHQAHRPVVDDRPAHARCSRRCSPSRTPRQRFYMVGETYDFGNQGFIKSFIDPATKLDGQFDFPLRRVLLQATVRGAEPMSNLSSFMDGNDGFYGANAVMSTWIGNHDLRPHHSHGRAPAAVGPVRQRHQLRLERPRGA